MTSKHGSGARSELAAPRSKFAERALGVTVDATPMTRTIEFFFDFGSPFAYLANSRLPALASDHGCAIAYRPIDLQKAKLAVGNTGPATREMPVKHRYIWDDLHRWGAHYGVPIDPVSGLNARPLNLLAFLAIDRSCARDYVDFTWGRIWGQGGAIDTNAVLQAIAGHLGWDEREMLDFIDSDQASARLSAANEHAYANGIFGVPAMLIENHLWWGNDRLMFLEEYLKEDEYHEQR